MQVKNYKGPVRDTCKSIERTGYMDLNLSKQDTGMSRKADHGGISLGEMEEPKLFFSAFNFLGKDSPAGRNHFADFAVLEITFTNEDVAKRVTDNFAIKYKERPQDVIDVFSPPIEKKYQTREGKEL
ncbi:hypothetical protein B4U78_016660 [Microbacterium esteraromaticum]|nr:hypothetical protein B4U78_016660 [Microbacterium esteraromaticum]